MERLQPEPLFRTTVLNRSIEHLFKPVKGFIPPDRKIYPPHKTLRTLTRSNPIRNQRKDESPSRLQELLVV